MIYTIYFCANKVNNKKYVGFDSNCPKRRMQHRQAANNKNNNTYNTPFHAAIRKYGWDSFVWQPIYQSNYNYHTLNIMERYFIEHYRTYYSFSDCAGYNLTLGSEGILGKKYQ